MHSVIGLQASSAQSILPLQSLSMPSSQTSAPVGVQFGTTSTRPSVGVPDELAIPELPVPLEPLELVPSEYVTSGTELHALATRIMPATATTAVAKEKRRTQ